MTALDSKDRVLLDLLCRDARLPLKTLAARVGLARSSLRERIARLEATGVIRGYRADVAWPSDLPVLQAYVVVHLKRTPATLLIKCLRERPEIERCSSISGDTDLILDVSVEAMPAISALRDWLAQQPDVLSVKTEIVLRQDFRR